MLKLLLAVSAAPIVVSAAPAPERELYNRAAIVQVICPAVGGYSAGTAFRIGRGLGVSVNHVTAPGTCTIKGASVRVVYKSPTADFSMIASDEGPFLKVDCGGFIKGRHYLAVGYARGAPFLTTVDLVATGETRGGYAVLSGIFTMIPGQSGGPAIDAVTGAVVGTNNVYDAPRGLSGSVELRNTPVCGKA